MAYWNTKSQNLLSTENFGLGQTAATGKSGEFYELEPAIVLDIVLDKTHPIFLQTPATQTTIDVDHWPSDYAGVKAKNGDIDYAWIGRALVRLQYSSPNT